MEVSMEKFLTTAGDKKKFSLRIKVSGTPPDNTISVVDKVSRGSIGILEYKRKDKEEKLIAGNYLKVFNPKLVDGKIQLTNETVLFSVAAFKTVPEIKFDLEPDDSLKKIASSDPGMVRFGLVISG